MEAWKKCVELSLRKVQGKSSGYIANTQKKIVTLIDSYVYDPSLLRNKIAHGQWNVALNSNNTKVNETLTNKINAITVVLSQIIPEYTQSGYDQILCSQ